MMECPLFKFIGIFSDAEKERFELNGFYVNNEQQGGPMQKATTEKEENSQPNKTLALNGVFDGENAEWNFTTTTTKTFNKMNVLVFV